MRSIFFALVATCMIALAPSPSLARSEGSAIPLLSMDHVALNVSDLQQSADWYRRVLGFRISHKWNKTWMIRRGTMRIGLFFRPNAAKIEDLDNTRAITHFAYRLDAASFKQAIVTLHRMSVPFEGPEDTGIAHSVFLTDPDGYQVELTTYYQ